MDEQYGKETWNAAAAIPPEPAGRTALPPLGGGYKPPYAPGWGNAAPGGCPLPPMGYGAPNIGYGMPGQAWPAPSRAPGRGEAVASLTLGLFSLVFWLSGYAAILSVVLGILGLVMASLAKKAGYRGGIATAGFALGLVGLLGGLVVFTSCGLLMLACTGYF